MFSLLATVLGLCLFECVSSLDNAVINADILQTMSQKWRRRFLTWGILSSVFLVRALLPLLIVYLSYSNLGISESITATFSRDPKVIEAVEKAKPLLLMGGGVFLLFLFLHWLFLEAKEFGLKVERVIHQRGVWYYSLVSLILSLIIWQCVQIDPMMAFSASLGSSLFFIVQGFKDHARHTEQLLTRQNELSDISKFLYLEILDATFSIDGVVGAFAFTLSVPLIILGNGLGALIVRKLTVSRLEWLRTRPLLKNGAMYAIFILSLIMIIESFGVEIDPLLAPISTTMIIIFSFYKSKK